MDDIFSLAEYAFTAEYNVQTIPSIIGYPKTMEMFRYPEMVDLSERKKGRSVNGYNDELYFGTQEE